MTVPWRCASAVLPSPMGRARVRVMMGDSRKTSHSYQAKEVSFLIRGVLPIIYTGAMPEYKGVNEEILSWGRWSIFTSERH